MSSSLGRCLSSLFSAQPDLLTTRQGPEERSAAVDACKSSLAVLTRAITEEARRRDEVQAEYADAASAIRRCVEAAAGALAAVAVSPTSRWRGVNSALMNAQTAACRSLDAIESVRTKLMAAPQARDDGTSSFEEAVASSQQALQSCMRAVDAALRGHAELQAVLERWSDELEQCTATLRSILQGCLAIEALYADTLSAREINPPPERAAEDSPGEVLLNLFAPMPLVSSGSLSSGPEQSLSEEIMVATTALESAVSPPLVRVALREAVTAVLAARHEIFSAISDPAPAATDLHSTVAKLQTRAATAATTVAEARTQAQLFLSDHNQRSGAMASTAAILQGATTQLARHVAAANGFGLCNCPGVDKALDDGRQALEEANAIFAKPPLSAAAAAAQTVLAAEAARRANVAVSAAADAIDAELARKRDVENARSALRVSLEIKSFFREPMSLLYFRRVCL